MMFEQSVRFGSPPAPATSGPLVCVVDDEQEIRQSLGTLFEAANLPVDFYASAAEFTSRRRHQGPCCLVIDTSLPGMDCSELHQILIDSSDQIIVLTSRADVPTCMRAMKAGAVDFLTKPAEPGTLLEAASRALARSETVLATKIARSEALAKFTSLTAREFAVMQRVIAGLLNKQIAAELGIAEKTIKVHRARVMRKTGTVSVADLVRLSITADIPDSTGSGERS